MDERSALDVRVRAAADGRDSERAARTRGVLGERASLANVPPLR